MFAPITSEITIEKGMLLKEIASGKLYQVNRRIENNPDIATDPIWELNNVEETGNALKSLLYEELVSKYFAQVEE